MKTSPFEVKNFDSFAETHKELQRKTVIGGLVSILSCLSILILVVYELCSNLSTRWVPSLSIDDHHRQRMQIKFDITFPKVPCFVLTLDLMDDAGRHKNSITDDVTKLRLDQSDRVLGTFNDKALERPAGYCGSCFSADSKDASGKPLCCNSCTAVLAAYEAKKLTPPSLETIQQCLEENWAENIRHHSNEGCRIKGFLPVDKVSGNLHFAPGHSHNVYNYHFHDIRLLDGLDLDFSHRIHHFSFDNQQKFPSNPLDNTLSVSKQLHRCFKYYTKIVSTEFKKQGTPLVHTNQYAVAKNDLETNSESSSFPGVFFFYQVSPMSIIYKEDTKSMLALIVGLCSIVGGVYAVASIVDSLIHFADYHLRQKYALGKAN